MLYSVALSFLLVSLVAGYDMLYGEVTVDPWDPSMKGGTLGVQIDLRTDDVFITVDAPSDSWSAVGFGGEKMDGRYTIVTRMSGHQEERVLGDHNAGKMLEDSTTIFENTLSDDGMTRFSRVRRDTVITDANGQIDQNYWMFPDSQRITDEQRADPEFEIIIIIVFCHGRAGDAGLSAHGSANIRVARMSLRWACLALPDEGRRWIRRCPLANAEDRCSRRRCEWRC